MAHPPPRPELLALLNAAKAEPDDDTPRLVLADWLQEQPDPADAARGEWLRCLVEAERLTPEDPRRLWLVLRARELWQKHDVAWAKPFNQVAFDFSDDESTFHGGLLYPSVLGTDVVSKKGLAFVGSEAFAWVAGLSFRKLTSAQMPKLLAAPTIGLLSSLHFESETSLEQDDFQTFAACEAIAGLKSLSTQHAGIGYKGVVALAGSRHLAGLRHLSLGNEEITDRGFKALCDSKNLNALRSLAVPNCGLSIHSARAFEEGSGLPALTELNLGGTNAIGFDGARILVMAPRTGRLKKLNLWSNDIGDYGAEAIAQAAHVNRLTHLDLSGNRIGNTGAMALAAAAHLGTLEELNLRRNMIAGAGAVALAESPHLTKIKRLDVSANRIGERAGNALLERFGSRVVLD